LPGNGANVGLVLFYTGKFEAYQRTYVLNAFRDSVNARYVYHHLKKFWKRLNENSQFGSATNYIRMQNFEDYKIPLPPLPEQKRIAAILDKADDIRRKRRQAIDLADDFLRSVFLDMFGDSENRGWEISTVGEIADQKKGSMRTGPFGSQLLHSEFTDNGISVLGIDNVVSNTFKWAKPRFISQQKYEDELKRYTVKSGDVLISIMGTCGRCAIVPKDCPTAINTKHLCCITLDEDKILPDFLHSYFLHHPEAEKYLSKNYKGAIMQGLNMGIIKAMPIPLVPKELQIKYKTIVCSINKFKRKIESSSQLTENQFKAISQQAFTGKL